MNLLHCLAVMPLLALPLMAEPSAGEGRASPSPQAIEAVQGDEAAQARALRESLHASREQMLAQLEQASSPQDKRAVIEQWRQQSRPLIEQLEQQRSEAGVESASARTSASGKKASPTWTRPPIPDNLSAAEREQFELRYDVREAQMAMLAQLENASPQQRRQVMEDFREQNAQRMTRLRELSEEASFSAVAQSRGGQASARSSAHLELHDIPANLPAEQKARLQARNERLAAVNELTATLANASPEERRAAIDAYREKMTTLRESLSATGTISPARSEATSATSAD
ncbi:hypothetical protein H5P28_15540 [Ruficoccus amylovorans]|uniref:DUF3106 domain-containing protein n=1 Tax=Ruficoccus amylovorans TaxID=1804625 RepID=A0A842HKK6_9BACT|nr:hypothetical protein [Ruficoccus amylovorans]MBC2595681.1 hypothetical protein [Ruficoccus amylovorans]